MSHSLHLSKDIMSSLFSLQQSKLHALNTITSRRWPQFSTIRALVSIPNLICCVKSLSIQTHPVLSMRPWPWPYCSSTELRLAFCLGNARDKEFFKWGRLPEMLTRCQTQDNLWIAFLSSQNQKCHYSSNAWQYEKAWQEKWNRHMERNQGLEDRIVNIMA